MFKKLPLWVILIILFIAAVVAYVVIKVLSAFAFIFVLGVLTGMGIMLAFFPNKTSLRR